MTVLKLIGLFFLTAVAAGAVAFILTLAVCQTTPPPAGKSTNHAPTCEPEVKLTSWEIGHNKSSSIRFGDRAFQTSSLVEKEGEIYIYTWGLWASTEDDETCLVGWTLLDRAMLSSNNSIPFLWEIKRDNEHKYGRKITFTLRSREAPVGSDGMLYVLTKNKAPYDDWKHLWGGVKTDSMNFFDHAATSASGPVPASVMKKEKK